MVANYAIGCTLTGVWARSDCCQLAGHGRASERRVETGHAREVLSACWERQRALVGETVSSRFTTLTRHAKEAKEELWCTTGTRRFPEKFIFYYYYAAKPREKNVSVNKKNVIFWLLCRFFFSEMTHCWDGNSWNLRDVGWQNSTFCAYHRIVDEVMSHICEFLGCIADVCCFTRN